MWFLRDTRGRKSEEKNFVENAKGKILIVFPRRHSFTQLIFLSWFSSWMDFFQNRRHFFPLFNFLLLLNWSCILITQNFRLGSQLNSHWWQKSPCLKQMKSGDRMKKTVRDGGAKLTIVISESINSKVHSYRDMMCNSNRFHFPLASWKRRKIKRTELLLCNARKPLIWIFPLSW